jgi:hypothetical protein
MGQVVHNVEFRSAGQMTLADLPAQGCMYWCDRQKADVVAAVRSGLITFEQASERYMLSAEEFITWLKLDHIGRSTKHRVAATRVANRKVLERQSLLDEGERLERATTH